MVLFLTIALKVSLRSIIFSYLGWRWFWVVRFYTFNYSTCICRYFASCTFPLL